MAGNGDDWRPSERVVRQWARHVSKLRQQVKNDSADAPALRLLLKARDVSRFLTVSDGDGFLAAGLRIRLLGIDAPEYEQLCLDAQGRTWPCGERARWRLFELLSGKELELRVHDVDCYGRLLCSCYVEGLDVAETMVREGLAICYRSQRYAAAEREAASKGRGMWRGAFEEPESWRINQRATGNGATPATTEARQQPCRREQHVQRARLPARNGKMSNTCDEASQHSWENLRKSFMRLLKQLR